MNQVAVESPAIRGRKKPPFADRIKNSKYYQSFTWITALSVVALAAIVLASISAPLLAPYDPAEVNLKQRLAAPSTEHLLGTDGLGRDLFSRILYGIRVSLLVSVGGTVVAGAIGLVLGAISGYYGGLFDQIWLRVSEIFMAFPALVILLVLVAVMGPSMLNIIIIFAITKWATLYRLVRAQFFSLREEEFVEALKALNIGLPSIIFGHLVPNTLGPIAVWFTLEVASGIIQEAGLSFLGLGIQPPTPSLGNLLSAAQDLRILRDHAWLWIAPGFIVALITLCINFTGDWMRDVTDPRTAK
jgi:peptide/nickel transport system permease protein